MNILIFISVAANILFAIAFFVVAKFVKKHKNDIPEKRTMILRHMMDNAKLKLWKNDFANGYMYYADEHTNYGEGMPVEKHMLLKPAEDRKKCVEHITMLVENPEIKDSTLLFRYIDPASKDGYRYSTNYIYADRDESGKILACYALEQDITEQMYRVHELERKLKETREASKNKSLFVANASHDIRTPLNGIIGFTQLLRYEEDENERNGLYDNIEECANQLQSLINDILDVSKIEAGKMEFYYSDLHMDELMRDLMNTYNVQKKEEQEIVIKEPVSPVIIRFDRQRFIQIVNNFMSNAMKFTDQGEIKITYTYDQTDGFYLEVQDSGLGIPEENKPKIFMQFQKLNSDHQGTGLGLSICKEIVESQGGTIGFDSVLGKGSTFWFRLPESVCGRNQ